MVERDEFLKAAQPPSDGGVMTGEEAIRHAAAQARAGGT